MCYPFGWFTLPANAAYTTAGHISLHPSKGRRVIRLDTERGNVDATNGKIIVSRELLGSLLDNLETRVNLNPFTPHERESLEQLAVAVMSGDELTLSGDLLELWRSG